MVDAVSYLGLGGIFTAFMTGNVLFLSFAAAGGVGLAPAAALTALVAFIAGGIGGSRYWVLAGPGRKAFLVCTAASSLLLFAAGLLALRLSPDAAAPHPNHYPVIAVMAFAMGVRTMTIQRLGYGLITTLVTGTLISLLADSALGKGAGSRYQTYRIVTVFAVFAGGALGTLLLLRFGPALPLLVAGAVGVIGAVGGYLAFGSPDDSPGH